jgi:hypothetical protein
VPAAIGYTIQGVPAAIGYTIQGVPAAIGYTIQGVPAAIGYTIFVFIFVLEEYEEQKSKCYKFACFMRA